MPNQDRVQINVLISVDLAARLDNLSAAYRKRSRNQIAGEIIEQCVDIYEASEIAKYEVLRRSAAKPNAKKQ
jgi:predicted transcriptional regulator